MMTMIKLAFVATLTTIAAMLIVTTTYNVNAAEPTIKQGQQILRSGDNPIIITGPINPGPAGGIPPKCVEPLGCPPPPRDNARVSIPNLEIATANQPQEQVQVHQPGQQVVTVPQDDPNSNRPDDKKSDSQQEQEKDDGNN